MQYAQQSSSMGWLKREYGHGMALDNQNDRSKSDVRFERHGSIAVLVIDRPYAANAFGPKAVSEFRTHLDAIRCDETFSGLVVTGAGDRHFCSGGDVKAYSVFASAEELNPVFDDARAVLNELDMLGAPTVAAINGVAIGGGFELALACDFRIAHHSACMSLPQVRMGILPGWFATERLLEICGRANAKRFALSGARIAADEARHLGVVDQLTEGDVVEAAVNFLKQFEGADRRGIAAFKRVVRELADNGREAGQRLEREVFAELWFHPDRKR
jgi:enoyl-CoA hydratase/carnithine racemase